MDWTGTADPAGRRRLRRTLVAAWACLAIILMAAAATATVLHRGCAPAPLDERAAWVLSHLTEWRVGWAFWMLAAPAAVFFCAALGATLAPDLKLARLAALAVASLGAAADLAGLGTFAAVLPRHLAQLAPDPFDSVAALQSVRMADIYASVLSGGLASGLYTIAGLMLAWAAVSTPGFPRMLLWGAAPSGVCSVALTVSVLLQRPHAAAVSLASFLACFLAWLGATAFALRRRLAAPVDKPAEPG